MSDLQYRHRYLLKVGDQVRVRKDPDGRLKEEGERNPVGAIGEIVGFTLRSVCRTNSSAEEKAGIYLDTTWLYVRFGTAVIRMIRDNFLELVDAAEYGRRLQQSLLEKPHHWMLFWHGELVSDFPDTKFWEGDIVRLQNCYSRHLKNPLKIIPGSIPGLPDAYMVCHINFRAKSESTDGITESLDNTPLFGIGARFLTDWDGRWYDFELELVERGNFWRQAHGEPLVFRDLEEEAFWAWLTGQTVAVPEPPRPLVQTGFLDDYWAEIRSSLSPKVQEKEKAKWWDEGMAVAWINEGKAHGIQSHQFYADLYDSKPGVYHNVLRFKDEDLGKRVAAATANGFRVPSRDWDKGKYKK